MMTCHIPSWELVWPLRRWLGTGKVFQFFCSAFEKETSLSHFTEAAPFATNTSRFFQTKFRQPSTWSLWPSVVLTCSLLYLVWHRFPCKIAIIAACKFKTNSLKMVVQFRELDTLYEFELIRTIHWPSIFGRWDDFQKLLKKDINKTWFPGFHNFLAPRRWATWGHYGSLLHCDADRCPLLKGPLSLSSGGETWLFTQGFACSHLYYV